MDRKQQRRRLNDFRRSKGHCSASAMAQILQDIEQNGMPELTHRGNMRQARNDVTSTDTAFGPLLPHIPCVDLDGDPVRIPIAHPYACLTHVLAESESFRKSFRQRLTDRPATPEDPWTIVIYSDEVTPGNPLACANERKFQAVYWTFLELGVNALSRETSWFTLMTEYSSIVNNSLDSGLSQACGNLFHVFHRPPFDIRWHRAPLR